MSGGGVKIINYDGPKWAKNLVSINRILYASSTDTPITYLKADI